MLVLMRVLMLMLVLWLVLLMLMLGLMLLRNPMLRWMLRQPLFTVAHSYRRRTISHRRTVVSHRRWAISHRRRTIPHRRGAAVVMLRWRAVGMRVALVPLSKVIWRGRRRTLRTARVCHTNGRHRVHGRHVVRSVIRWRVAVVRMVWAWWPAGRWWRGTAANPSRGWGVLNAINKRGLCHMPAGWRLCWDADRRRS